MKILRIWLILCWSLLLSREGQAQYSFVYQTNGSQITLDSFTGAPINATIPDFVTAIGGNAFLFCRSLTNVVLGSGMTNMVPGTFFGCSSLLAIGVSVQNTAFSSVDGVLFDPGGKTLVVCPGGLAGNYTIPDGVTNIAESGFDGCGNLTNVVLPGSLISIGSGAFYYCIRLLDMVVPNGVTDIEDSAFVECTSMTNITIPTSLTNLADNLFDGCGMLGSVVIPGSVTNIGAQAFAGCTAMTNVVIPSSVKTIGEDAFEACSGLTNILIPASVTSVGESAFVQCLKLVSVVFFGNAPAVEYTVFGDDGPGIAAYYLDGTTGWSEFSFLAGIPVVLLNPPIVTSGGGFGVQNNRFGFTVNGLTNAMVVVQACLNLANPIWVAVWTNTLVSGSSFFSDPGWTNSPNRYYRVQFRVP